MLRMIIQDTRVSAFSRGERNFGTRYQDAHVADVCREGRNFGTRYQDAPVADVPETNARMM